MRKKITFAVAAMLLTYAGGAQALVVQYDLGTLLQGQTVTPGGSAPWLTAVFDDHGGSGSVDLTLTANAIGGQFVHEWDFNLDPALAPTSLLFTPVAGNTAPLATISTGVNFEKADGDGWFDIKFDFPTQGGPHNRFDESNSITYTISGISSLTANSFGYTSIDLPQGTFTPYHTAAHIQNIGTAGESTWIVDSPTEPVPEPATMLLLGTGLAGLAGARRKKKA